MWFFSLGFLPRLLIVAAFLTVLWGFLAIVGPKDGPPHTPGATSDNAPGRLPDPRCEPCVFAAYGSPTALRPASHWQRL